MRRRSNSAMLASLRLLVLAPLANVLAGCSGTGTPEPEFVQVEDGRFVLGGEDYRFVGVNIWYAAYLGAEEKEFGDTARLGRELDLLKATGVTNLRILGGSEESTIDVAIRPAIQRPDGSLDDELLQGLDIVLAEMAARDMKAVIYLTNFWEWSGGMATYLSWHNGGFVVDAADPGVTWWPDFAIFTKDFYSNDAAVAQYHDYIRTLVNRRNSVTGVLYRDDPTIMAWQLANEPRPGVTDELGEADLEGFLAWIESSARLLSEIAPNQLVSTGNEGITGCLDDAGCARAAHAFEAIDYLTAHIWPLNWGWLDPEDMPGSLPRVLEKTDAYLLAHQRMAQSLGKPLVIEEFGLPRDNGSLEPGSATLHRDQFIGAVLDRVEENAAEGGPIAGTNIWSWGGLGRTHHPDGKWRLGDISFTGDPPQEPQGLNSVFADDSTTLDVIREHAKNLGKVTGSPERD